MAEVNQEVRTSKHIWPFVYAAMLFGMIAWLNFITADDRQYSRLAESVPRRQAVFAFYAGKWS